MDIDGFMILTKIDYSFKHDNINISKQINLVTKKERIKFIFLLKNIKPYK